MSGIIFSAKNTALTLLKAGTGNNGLFQTGRKNDADSQTDPLLAALEKSDPEKAGVLRKKLEDSRNMLRQLESSKKDINEQRKSAAAEKVARIKEKLRALRMLAAVNPEAAARQAKQLARELKQAVQEYAGASGGGTGISLQNNPTATGTGANAGTAGTEIAATETATTGATAETETVTAHTDTTPKAATTETESGATPAPNGKNSENGENTEEGQAANTGQTAKAEADARTTIEEIEKKTEEEKEAFRKGIQAQVAKINESFAGSKADQNFAKTVEEVKNALKNILETIKRKLAEKKNSPLAERDIKDAENALEEVDKALGDIASDSTTSGSLEAPAINGTSTVNILA